MSTGAEVWCDACSYVPPDVLVAHATAVMPVSLVRGGDGVWSARADGVWGDSTSLRDSTGWGDVRAREECDRWLGAVSLLRVSEWVPVSSGAWHAHCVMGSDFEVCSSCGCLVVGGLALTLTRRAGLRLSRGDGTKDGFTQEMVLCSKPDCLATALVVVRGFHQSAVVADVPLWPGV